MGGKQSNAEVQAAAGALRMVRMLLETVPIEMLEEVMRSSQHGLIRYQTLGPMLDPTDFQRHGADKERNFGTEIAAARALIDLKKAWRQDVPMDERIQEELDRGAPKGADGEPEDAAWLRERDVRAGR